MSDALSITEIRAMAFVDREKQTFSRYAELFPNYEWTDSATAIDLMAAEIKCLRSELLDACRLATSLRGFAGPMMVRATTKPASWVEWKKTCARLVDLLIEIRARWYAGTFSESEAPEKQTTDPEEQTSESVVVGQTERAALHIQDQYTKSGPGDCMNFGTPEQLAEFPNPQPLSKIASARRRVDLDARNRERKV
jgi:hypothetical protein